MYFFGNPSAYVYEYLSLNFYIAITTYVTLKTTIGNNGSLDVRFCLKYFLFKSLCFVARG